MLYEVIPTRVFRQDGGILTYSSDTPLSPGQIVLIPLGRSTCPGIVLRRSKEQSPTFKVRPITKILYDTPVPSWLLFAIQWLSQYYAAPLPQVASLVLPRGVDKARRHKTSNRTEKTSPTTTPDIRLNSAQKSALENIAAVSSATKLLHGITGSGKTNIYLTLAAKTLKNHQSVILLVPEISLTPQLVSIFEQTFPQNVTLLHSRQTEATRHQLWTKILNNPAPQVIIGPRSALFAPVNDLGLIIIDEAHESAYFQENTPKYSAIRLASAIASRQKITCLLGTATPLVVDYYLAKRNHSLITLTKKAKATVPPTKLKVIDLKDRSNFTKNRYFSNQLLANISTNLANHHQSLIFHNRRGSAPLTICESCSWQALCPNCFLPYTLHVDDFQLLCHTCGHQATVPSNCPDCHHNSIIHKGFGTKLLENELKRLFPEATVARFDADNQKSESLDQLYDSVKNGDIDIIIGTQTVAKGLDLPHLATVGVVQADAGLSLPDYAAEERTFHLLTQVLGRVGRGHLDTATAVIQTYQPDHPVITSALSEDYQSFYNYLLGKRRQAHFPPFCYFAKLSLTYKTESITLKNISLLHHSLSAVTNLSVSVPTPAFHERTTSGYTWQLILKSSSRTHLLSVIANLPKNPHLHLALDPPSLL